MDYKAGVVHLSSSDGMLLEIPESSLSEDDLGYVQSQVYEKGQQKVTFLFRSCPFPFADYNSEQAPQGGMSPTSARVDFSHYLTGLGEPAAKRPGFVGRLLARAGLRRNR